MQKKITVIVDNYDEVDHLLTSLNEELGDNLIGWIEEDYPCETYTLSYSVDTGTGCQHVVSFDIPAPSIEFARNVAKINLNNMNLASEPIEVKL